MLTLLVAGLGLPGCATRVKERTVYESYDLTVALRARQKWFGGEVERGLQHPAALPADLLGRILAAAEVDVPKDEDSPVKERRAAIPPDFVMPIARALSLALEEAGPNQEITVMALRKRMQKGIFNRKFLTSFVAFVQDDRLNLYFSRIDWRIDSSNQGKMPGANTYVPKPSTKGGQMRFRPVTNAHFQPVGAQGVSVSWADPVFAATADPRGSGGGDRPIGALNAEQLRRLADLEEQRSVGAISQAEYERQLDALYAE